MASRHVRSSASTSIRRTEALLTEGEVAAFLKLTKRALQAWRCRGYGPPFVRISGRAIRYRRQDVSQWIGAKLRSSTSDPGPEREPEDR